MTDTPKAPLRLTVTIRDESPVIHLQEPCTYRTVRVRLTEDQAKRLALRHANEDIAFAVLEQDDAES